MRRKAPINCYNSPLVVHHPDLWGADGEHRLNCQAVPFGQGQTLAASAVVGHLGGLMHGTADAMSHVGSDDPVPRPQGNILNGAGDLFDGGPRSGGGDAGIQGLTGYRHQALRLRSALADHKAARPVSMPPLPDRPRVDGDERPIFDLAVARDAVDNLTVKRDANEGGEAVVPLEV